MVMNNGQKTDVFSEVPCESSTLTQVPSWKGYESLNLFVNPIAKKEKTYPPSDWQNQKRASVYIESTWMIPNWVREF